MKYIYLDYAATTPVHPSVLRALVAAAKKYPGNPNSNHVLGQTAAEVISKSLDRMRRILGLSKHYALTPTSGSSESNNLALKGVALHPQAKGKHIIITAYEHSSLTASANYLSQKGFEVGIAPCDSRGRVDVAGLEDMIRPDTIMISIASINAEIGIRQPIEAISAMLMRHRQVYFHVDATQSIGKDELKLEGIDMVSLTAHKLFGFKGIGLFIKHERVPLTPLIHGGHSTTNDRRGTPATELILSMEKALKLAFKNQPENRRQIQAIRDYAWKKLSVLPRLVFNSRIDDLPCILNFSLLGKKSTETVAFLSQKGICISNHSACESAIDLSSAVLALTGDREQALSSVRLSFAPMTTTDDIDQLVTALKEYLK
jgi:cysteine desulfurase